MSDVVFLEAYRDAIFRGSREQPKWDRAVIARCWRQLRFDQANGKVEAFKRQQDRDRYLSRKRAMDAFDGGDAA